MGACIRRGAGIGGSEGILPPQLWSCGAPPPQPFIGLGTFGAVVLPKLGFVGQKGKLNGRKHFSEKSSSFIISAAHMADKPFAVATKVLSLHS